jgi:CheY-like chemotaxis protein
MKVDLQITPFKILLADDDKDDSLFFENALKEGLMPTQLKMVNDGEQLMEYLSENAENLPDILFLDLNMPRKNGFECLAEIKGIPLYKNLYVVMFSTSYPRDHYYEKDMIDRLLKFGANHFIRKPDDFDQLIKVIQQALTMAIDFKSKMTAENLHLSQHDNLSIL